MVESVLVIGVAVSVFVGFNIGGSSTGIAWGPAVGAGLIGKATAAAIMTGFVFLGGWTVGRNVMETLSDGIITIEISLTAGVAILFFIGLGILVANIFGVPVPTSMTTVGAIAGLGLATDTLNHETVAWILSWWIFTPVFAFMIGAIIGRYVYAGLSRRVQIENSDGPLVVLDGSGRFPTPALGPNTTWREIGGTTVIVVLGCYMAFSAGASNVPNAAAPLVSGGALAAEPAIVVAAAAIGLGGFTIARRTMESVGSDISDIPLLGALIIMLTAASITTALSYIGIPISLVMASVGAIVGLGWGRATRPIAAREAISREPTDTEIVMGALTAEDAIDDVAPIGEDEPEDVREADELFKPEAVIRYVTMWIVGPSMSTILAYVFFVSVPGAV
ncbi:inorganic phosphate transporter, PiT family [Natronorubrum sediminis]|uniref:Phosphate transporter n=1 Tax=Natronorubrum sediminis TaxID=640943 RepID=A0A1H6G0M5_9EURY|nr:inorganic phosphate transporter [Natronorubrum sediminis]SEH15455.1 inorganic phosphate transporter, PiT family [Natronorubrum sediminis]